MKKLNLILWLSGILILLFAGCMPSNEFNYIERAIRKQIYPAKIKTKFKFSFGPISLSTIKTVVNFTDASDEAISYLAEIKKVQVGVYEIRNVDRSSQLRIPPDAEKKLNELGWEIFIRVKEKNEHVDLFYKQINKYISSMYVIVVEDDELVIVEVKGKLDRLIEKAIQEPGFPHQKGMFNFS